MAFGIKRDELVTWKNKVKEGEIAFLTHYWYDPRFPEVKTVTKVGCADLEKLIAWGKQYNIPAKYIDNRYDFPHFDLLGERQVEIMSSENKLDQLQRFKR
ncbi:hypothetical protein DS745_02210 [Anaerobacillus alkaliphilus]|uniref:YneQ n=1 Tax=Anaerobacillus alkaliphilus TaxID=1548597 RepID=A0A4Q0VXU1_9BACI|nr:hypothetical protein [Anaerobacillus alkaliphilus]RXJ04222.1 hypothetical protein DS745_02210 [Anaerobacillus alkaliphilus]